MIQHYIKVALRLIERSMLFSLINMLGFVKKAWRRHFLFIFGW